MYVSDRKYVFFGEDMSRFAISFVFWRVRKRNVHLPHCEDTSRFAKSDIAKTGRFSPFRLPKDNLPKDKPKDMSLFAISFVFWQMYIPSAYTHVSCEHGGISFRIYTCFFANMCIFLQIYILLSICMFLLAQRHLFSHLHVSAHTNVCFNTYLFIQTSLLTSLSTSYSTYIHIFAHMRPTLWIM